MARLVRAALASTPALASTSARLAANRIAHNPNAAVWFAALAGTVTLAAVFLVLVAQVSESWILHRSEQHFSSAVKQAVMVAIGDSDNDRRIAALEVSERLGITHLADATLAAMRITHEHPGHALSSPPRPVRSVDFSHSRRHSGNPHRTVRDRNTDSAERASIGRSSHPGKAGHP